MSACSRSVKKLKSHGWGTFSIVTRIAPNGYTPGFRDTSRMLAIGMANFAGAGLNGPLAPPCPPLGVNAAASLRKHRKLLKTKISPLSSGVSPLQHSNTPSRRSFSSRSLKWCRIASATRRLSFAVPLDSARRQYAPKSAPSI